MTPIPCTLLNCQKSCSTAGMQAAELRQMVEGIPITGREISLVGSNFVVLYFDRMSLDGPGFHGPRGLTVHHLTFRYAVPEPHKDL